VFDEGGSFSLGAVVVDPKDSNVVWLGTGENNNQRSVAFGDGVYKSTDAGKSWTRMGLENSEHIQNILIDPRNSNTVYVTAIGPLWRSGGDRGLFKTTDGGKTWKNVLHVSEDAWQGDAQFIVTVDGKKGSWKHPAIPGAKKGQYLRVVLTKDGEVKAIVRAVFE